MSVLRTYRVRGATSSRVMGTERRGLREMPKKSLAHLTRISRDISHEISRGPRVHPGIRIPAFTYLSYKDVYVI